jgi:hypothetical protein
MTIAFLPWPVSIYEIPGVSIMPPSAHRLSNRVVPMCPNFHVRFAGDGPLQLVVPFCSRLLYVYGCRCMFARAAECTSGWLSSYLAGGDELERPEGGLHVRDVGLELVERSRDAGLDLRGLGPRGAVGRDLVEGLLRHDGRLRYRYPGRRGASRIRRCSRLFDC